MMTTQRVRVRPESYEGLIEKGFDLASEQNVEQEVYAKFAEKSLLRLLTRRQQQIVLCLSEGLNRKEIALRLMISTQEVHQIIPRIRKRLEKYQQTQRREESWVQTMRT